MANSGSSSVARRKKGRDAAAPRVACTCQPALYAFSASSDGVVASAKGVEYFLTLASDSPARPLNALAIRLSSLSTSSFLAACCCCSSRISPSRQSFARKPRTYSLPSVAMEPSTTAAAPVRSQTSCAVSPVNRASAGRPMRTSVRRMRCSEIRLRKGDCSNCIARPCRRVSSKTGSPVEFAKSASTTVSLSVRTGLRFRKNRIAPAPATSTTMAAAAIHKRGFVSRTCICTVEWLAAMMLILDSERRFTSSARRYPWPGTVMM